MKFFPRPVSLLMLLLIFSGACKNPPKHRDEVPPGMPVQLKYAERFRIWQLQDHIEITVHPQSATGEIYTYALIPEGTDMLPDLQADEVVQVPVKNLVVTSTSHLPFLDLLAASEFLKGFPNIDYVSSPAIRERIDRGLVKDVGHANGLNYESLVELQPELVMSYISGPDRGEMEQLQNTGIPTVVNLDFLESSPLGRAEWIKFVGMFLDRYQFADSVFSGIETRYLQLKSKASQLAETPTVFSGIVYGDTWFAPGGHSFVAKFIADAGGAYSWKDHPVSGSVELGFEAVLDRDLNSQFWIGAGGFTSKADLRAADPRYANFAAFKNDRIYNYHGKIGATGGFEYLEAGGARPDLVLGDFIRIIHPEVLPDYQTYYFKKLD